MKAFPVHLNSHYIYPIEHFDALKTWMNKVLSYMTVSALRISTLTFTRLCQIFIEMLSQ